MIIVRLSGGLGNQMFQYAAGRALSYHRGIDFFLHPDFTGNKITPRNYRLNNLNVIESFAKDDHGAQFWSKNSPDLIKKLLVQFQHYYPCMKNGYLDDNLVYLFPGSINKFENIYLDGFWQSEKFFRDIKDIIKKEFTIKNEPSLLNKNMIEKIIETNSVSVHIRRGDFITNVAANQCHGVCSLDYYFTAIDTITESINNPHFYIFSDDPEWCRNNFNIRYPVTFISHNGPDHDYEDLRLMSTCKHHIIANSSFSWWGAWLCEYDEKLIFAPKKWFKISQFNESEIIPVSWSRI